MARDDEDSPKKPRAFVVGQDVSALSIADLDAEIIRLREEIERLASVRDTKRATQSAADALFKKPG